MKKLFSILAACTAFAAAACLYETETADVQITGIRLPYISHINGRDIWGSRTDKPGRYFMEEGFSRWRIYLMDCYYEGNLPITVTIDVNGYLNLKYDNVIGWTSLDFFNASVQCPASHGVTMKLYYSTDGGSTWILAQQRKFANANVNAIVNIPFGHDSIPAALPAGSTLKLRLVSFPTAYPESESFANVNYFYFDPSKWVGVSQSEVLKLLCFCHEVTITITGPRRGGR